MALRGAQGGLAREAFWPLSLLLLLLLLLGCCVPPLHANCGVEAGGELRVDANGTLLVCPPGGENGVVHVGGSLANPSLGAKLDQLHSELDLATSRVVALERMLQDLRRLVNECTLGTHNCHATNGTCTVVPGGSFTCACNAGFVGNGIACTIAVNFTGTVYWTRETGSADNDDSGSVAVDDAGRVFMVGNVRGPVDDLAFAGGSFDVFVVAYNGSTGTKLWSQMLGASGIDYVYGVTTDGTGSVYVTGRTTSLSLDGQTNAGQEDMFLVRFDISSGTKIWTRLLGTADEDFGLSVAVDRSIPDAIYVGGFTRAANGSGLPGSAGGLGGNIDAFVARYASNGTLLWVRHFGSKAGDVFRDVAVYQSEVYAAGETNGVVPGAFNTSGWDILIARITASGVAVWTAQLGSTGNNQGRGLAVDSSGVYVTGYTDRGMSGQPYAGGSTDAFLARYTHAGAWAWTQMLGTSASDLASSVALHRSGSVLVTGFTNGTLSDQTNAGRYDVFVASFTSAGVLQWTRLYGSTSDDYGVSIAVDPSSSAAYLAGWATGSILGQPTSPGNELFLMKLL